MMVWLVLFLLCGQVGCLYWLYVMFLAVRRLEGRVFKPPVDVGVYEDDPPLTGRIDDAVAPGYYRHPMRSEPGRFA